MRIKFTNTFVDKISLEHVVKLVSNNVNEKIKTHIVFLNALKIYEIEKNPFLKRAMHEAELILADGMPIVWFSKLYGSRLPGRVNGTDLFELLLRWANDNEKKVFLLGTTEENLQLLVKKISISYPRIKLSYRNGYFTDKDDSKVIEQINLSNSDLLFLGFSSPKKEIWANKYKHQINTPIIQGVGGSFDVVAGVIRRAPVWMQKIGLEWFFRLVKEPRRMFKRYLITNCYFLYLVVKYYFKKS